MKLEDFSDINPLNRRFAEYWLSLPRQTDVPMRKDFDPAAVPRLLPRFLMHEIRDRSRLHIRLCGTGLVQRYGMDITGRDYLDFVPEARRAHSLEAMLAMTDWPAGCLTRMNVRTTAGRVLQTESLGLPLSLGDGRPPLVLFHSHEDRSFGFAREPGERLEHTSLRERIFLDIGNGTPPPIAGETYSDP